MTSAEARPTTDAAPPGEQPRHQTMLARAALAFVALRRRTDARFGRADSAAVALRLLFAEEISRHQSLRIEPSRDALDSYRRIRRTEDSLLAHLATLAPLASPAVVAEVVELRGRAGRWHARTDARAEGRMTEAEFVAALPALRA